MQPFNITDMNPFPNINFRSSRTKTIFLRTIDKFRLRMQKGQNGNDNAIIIWDSADEESTEKGLE